MMAKVETLLREFIIFWRDAKSAWHRVKNADEIWIYLRGDPLNLWCQALFESLSKR